MSYSEITSLSDADLLILFQPKNGDTRVVRSPILMQYIQENLDTGVLETKGQWRGEWSAGNNYTENDIFKVTSSAAVYIVLEAHQSTDISTDETLGRIEKMVEGTVISEPQIADNVITTIKIVNEAVTTEKIEQIANNSVLGNISGVSASPSGIPIVTDNTLTSGGDGDLVSKASIKAYFDDNRPLQSNEIVAENVPNGELPIAKLETIPNLTVVGNISGSTATPTEVAIVNDDTFATGNANDLVRKGSIQAYVDSLTSPQIAHFREEQTTGVDGELISASTWTKVPLNTQRWNNISGASISEDRITLPAGTFEIKASVPIRGVKESFSIRLRNVTDVTTTDSGYPVYTPRDGDADHSGEMRANLYSIFTISATKTFEVQCYVSSDAIIGASYSASAVQIYSDVVIKKLPIAI